MLNKLRLVKTTHAGSITRPLKPTAASFLMALTAMGLAA